MGLNEPETVADARRALGDRLAALRSAAGLRQRQLATLVSYCRSSVANVETGTQRAPRQFWIRCDQVLGTGEALTAQYDYVENVRRECAGALVDDLTATPGGHHMSGTRSATADPRLVPHWMRMLQALTTSHNLLGPYQIHEAVSHESAIIRRYRHEAVGEVKTGLLGVEARWAEFASWTADNVDDRAAAVFWLRRALELARRAGDGVIVAYVLMRKAQQAADRLDGDQATVLATAAGAMASLAHRDRALCAVRKAQGHALRGDVGECRAALRSAHRFVTLAASDGEDPATIGVHCVRPYVQSYEGYCYLRLGHTATAVTLLEQALTAWPGVYRQDEGLARAWLAGAYAARNRLPEAGAQGSQALSLTATTAWSSRTLRALGHLDARLATTASTAEVTQFRTAYSRAAAGHTIRP